MRQKYLNILLILSPLIAYLEWGQNNSTFLYEAEYDILIKMWSSPGDLLHPFIIIPFAGQITLLITLFQKEPDKRLIYTGIACSSLLMVFLLFIGLMGMNYKTGFSVVPYFSVLVVTLRHLKIQQRNLPESAGNL